MTPMYACMQAHVLRALTSCAQFVFHPVQVINLLARTPFSNLTGCPATCTWMDRLYPDLQAPGAPKAYQPTRTANHTGPDSCGLPGSTYGACYMTAAWDRWTPGQYALEARAVIWPQPHKHMGTQWLPRLPSFPFPRPPPLKKEKSMPSQNASRLPLAYVTAPVSAADGNFNAALTVGPNPRLMLTAPSSVSASDPLCGKEWTYDYIVRRCCGVCAASMLACSPIARRLKTS